MVTNENILYISEITHTLKIFAKSEIAGETPESIELRKYLIGKKEVG